MNLNSIMKRWRKTRIKCIKNIWWFFSGNWNVIRLNCANPLYFHEFSRQNSKTFFATKKSETFLFTQIIPTGTKGIEIRPVGISGNRCTDNLTYALLSTLTENSIIVVNYQLGFFKIRLPCKIIILQIVSMQWNYFWIA